MIVEVRECWCVRSTWLVHVFICKEMFCRKCLMRVPQVAWRWEGLWCDGEGSLGSVVSVCVDGCVMSASSAVGEGAGWAMEAFIVA